MALVKQRDHLRGSFCFHFITFRQFNLHKVLFKIGNVHIQPAVKQSWHQCALQHPDYRLVHIFILEDSLGESFASSGYTVDERMGYRIPEAESEEPCRMVSVRLVDKIKYLRLIPNCAIGEDQNLEKFVLVAILHGCLEPLSYLCASHIGFKALYVLESFPKAVFVARLAS